MSVVHSPLPVYRTESAHTARLRDQTAEAQRLDRAIEWKLEELGYA